MSGKRSWARRLLAPVVRRGHGLARDEDGAVAVEFALLAIPFFTLILGILETSLTFFAQQVLESALQDATRQVRTGQSQGVWDADDFRKELCDGTFGMFECTNNPDTDRLLVTLEPVTDFSNAATETATKPIDDGSCTMTSADPATDCQWTLAESFDDGDGSDVIIARAFYKWPTILNVPWFSLATQAGNNRLLSAVRVFKNEPF